MALRVNAVSRESQEWIRGRTSNPYAYQRLPKQQYSCRRKVKTLRLKNMPQSRRTRINLENFEFSSPCGFISPLALFHRLKTAYAGSIADVRNRLQSMASIASSRSSLKLTKFEKRYLAHLRQILEAGQSIVI